MARLSKLPNGQINVHLTGSKVSAFKVDTILPIPYYFELRTEMIFELRNNVMTRSTNPNNSLLHLPSTPLFPGLHFCSQAVLSVVLTSLHCHPSKCYSFCRGSSRPIWSVHKLSLTIVIYGKFPSPECM